MPQATPPGRPELWAGLECTLNRVGNRYSDQFARSGHDRRADADLARVAELGVRTIRYPVLWERVVREGWDWCDARLQALRDLGIRPVLGLVHHGSGPPSTSLVESSFAPGLAAFALEVAKRYPWVDAFTPVNEPLTTARFSGLYGHWYPHGTSDRSFVRCLLNQCRAVSLSMLAIRRVTPHAELVQTEDLGRVSAPPHLHYQADFENERRWLSWDLLAGRVTPRHRLWRYLRKSGATEVELGEFFDAPCVPDVLGVNHYITSERYLDDRTEYYPEGACAGNGREAYADTEAVRVLADGVAGPEAILREAWERYELPVAVTEAHLGCDCPLEQVRWLAEVYGAASRLRAGGADFRAVTAWSLFGAFDWDSLVTQENGSYEPGAFDVRHDPPAETPLAGLIRDLAAGRPPSHAALESPGWWHRPERLSVPPVWPAERLAPARAG